MDIDAFRKALDKDLANPNGYWNTIKKKQEIDEKRYDRFEKWLETNDFDSLMQRFKDRYTKEYRDKCYKKGYEPYFPNLVRFVSDYVILRTSPIETSVESDNPFVSTEHFFKGYLFVLICGQGCFTRIYKKNPSTGEFEHFMQE